MVGECGQIRTVMKKNFKTKHNYHDADIIGYQWEEDELVFQISRQHSQCVPSAIRFSGVKNKKEIDQDLKQRDYQVPNCNICSIEKTDKQEFTVYISPPLKIVCNSFIEL